MEDNSWSFFSDKNGLEMRCSIEQIQIKDCNEVILLALGDRFIDVLIGRFVTEKRIYSIPIQKKAKGFKFVDPTQEKQLRNFLKDSYPGPHIMAHDKIRVADAEALVSLSKESPPAQKVVQQYWFNQFLNSLHSGQLEKILLESTLKLNKRRKIGKKWETYFERLAKRRIATNRYGKQFKLPPPSRDLVLDFAAFVCNESDAGFRQKIYDSCGVRVEWFEHINSLKDAYSEAYKHSIAQSGQLKERVEDVKRQYEITDDDCLNFPNITDPKKLKGIRQLMGLYEKMFGVDFSIGKRNILKKHKATKVGALRKLKRKFSLKKINEKPDQVSD